MRIPSLLILGAIGLIVLGLYLLQLDGEHISTGQDTAYHVAGGIGLSLLVAAGLGILAVYGYLSRKLSHGAALLLGIATLVVALGLWKFMMLAGVSIHSWTILLLFPPLLAFVAGSIATIAGGVRLLIAVFKSGQS